MKEFAPVPVTPDACIIWEATDHPELKGVILAGPDTSLAVGVLKKVALITGRRLPLRRISGGTEGYVYEWPRFQLALKVMHRLGAGNFQALRANVTLSEGLNRLAPQATVAYGAPQYMAAYFPYPENHRTRETWAMSYEAAVERHCLPYHLRGKIPSTAHRQLIYKMALEQCGGIASQYYLDMDAANEGFRDTRSIPAEPDLTIIKFDIAPLDRLALHRPPDTSLYSQFLVETE